jgi:hypothetical protein
MKLIEQITADFTRNISLDPHDRHDPRPNLKLLAQEN